MTIATLVLDGEFLTLFDMDGNVVWSEFVPYEDDESLDDSGKGSGED